MGALGRGGPCGAQLGLLSPDRAFPIPSHHLQLDGCQLGDRGGHGGSGRLGLGGRVLSALERDEVPFILFLSLEVPLRSDLNLSCC